MKVKTEDIVVEKVENRNGKIIKIGRFYNRINR